jgi:hypothetical protein
MEVETLKMKMGATRPTARQYESVRADIELEITIHGDERRLGQEFKKDWTRLKRSAKVLLLEAMAEAEKVTGLRSE